MEPSIKKDPLPCWKRGERGLLGCQEGSQENIAAILWKKDRDVAPPVLTTGAPSFFTSTSETSREVLFTTGCGDFFSPDRGVVVPGVDGSPGVVGGVVVGFSGVVVGVSGVVDGVSGVVGGVSGVVGGVVGSDFTLTLRAAWSQESFFRDFSGLM